jgi:hypothetical protein
MASADQWFSGPTWEQTKYKRAWGALWSGGQVLCHDCGGEYINFVCVCVCVQYWGLIELRADTWATPPAFFCDGFFQDRVSQTICPVWLQTRILLISASQVARIKGVSHQRLLEYIILCIAKTLWIMCLKLMNFNVCKLYINKAN